MGDEQLEKCRALLLQGEFGLEMEGLRVKRDGFLSHTPHPFGNHSHIVRDFCENQIEINTGVENSPRDAVEVLGKFYREIQTALYRLPEPEYLWPFSNPPYIKGESDIPIAQFAGAEREKTVYRNYLSERYGRYKMTFCGIHLNYSFTEEFLQLQYKQSGLESYQAYKNQFYLQLAEKLVQYGWLLVAVTAASPMLDSSFVETGIWGRDAFSGMSSVRCSELGYWNFFTPVFSYSDLDAYLSRLQWDIDEEWITSPSELYYPIRVKPKGENSISNLKENGINHIELRMIDVNPLAPYGIDERDVEFVQLLMGWLVSLPSSELSWQEQIQAVQNMKDAAHYDWKTVRIQSLHGNYISMEDGAVEILQDMKQFYETFPEWDRMRAILDFEEEKFKNPSSRYAWQIRQQYGEQYVEKGLQLAKKKQKACIR